MRKFLTFLLIFVLGLFFIVTSSRADELEELQKQINDLGHQLELSKNATTPLVLEVKNLETQLA